MPLTVDWSISISCNDATHGYLCFTWLKHSVALLCNGYKILYKVSSTLKRQEISREPCGKWLTLTFIPFKSGSLTSVSLYGVFPPHHCERRRRREKIHLGRKRKRIQIHSDDMTMSGAAQIWKFLSRNILYSRRIWLPYWISLAMFTNIRCT